jgi:hypothetical protein
MWSYRRLIAALTLGAGLAAAISIALSAGDASAAKKKRRHPHADAAASAPAAAPPRTAAPAASSSGLLCYYGKATDGHTGRERCLAPEELDPPLHILVDTRQLAEELGMLHAPEPADASVTPNADADVDSEEDAGDDSVTSGGFKARVVSVSFENGVVGRAQRSLKNMRAKMAECADSEGGLKSKSARLKLLFLVRARGHAEGLIVSSARNIPPKVVKCITKLIENQPIGTPSNDPVGVTALIELKEKE